VLLTAEVILWTVTLAGKATYVASTNPEKPPAPKPPVHLPSTPPAGFALPEKRGGLFGGNK
jgi:hypothetical protein